MINHFVDSLFLPLQTIKWLSFSLNNHTFPNVIQILIVVKNIKHYYTFLFQIPLTFFLFFFEFFQIHRFYSRLNLTKALTVIIVMLDLFFSDRIDCQALFVFSNLMSSRHPSNTQTNKQTHTYAHTHTLQLCLPYALPPFSTLHKSRLPVICQLFVLWKYTNTCIFLSQDNVFQSCKFWLMLDSSDFTH